MPATRIVRAIVLVFAVASLATGCGGRQPPRLAHADAAALIALSARIARAPTCAQARDIRLLERKHIALVNAHRVPAALQEQLSSGVNALVTETPPCLPTLSNAGTAPLPAPAAPAKGKRHEHGHGHGHGDGGGGD